MPNPEYYKVGNLAEILGVKDFTLRNWRKNNRGPVATKTESGWRYAHSDVVEWLRTANVEEVTICFGENGRYIQANLLAALLGVKCKGRCSKPEIPHLLEDMANHGVSQLRKAFEDMGLKDGWQVWMDREFKALIKRTILRFGPTDLKIR